MFIFTRTSDDVIIETAQELGRQSNGNYLLDPIGEKDMGRLAIPDKDDIAMYEVEEIPEEVEQEKYCYTEELGFFKNENWRPYISEQDRIEMLEDMVNMLLLGGE